jgi:hypothetical protein
MKKAKLSIAALCIAAAGLFAFKAIEGGSIKGTVSPAEGATTVLAISATDTLKTDIKQGAFEILDVKANTYKLVVEAAAPYKSATVNDVKVEEGKATDVGEIKLVQ